MNGELANHRKWHINYRNLYYHDTNWYKPSTLMRTAILKIVSSSIKCRNFRSEYQVFEHFYYNSQSFTSYDILRIRKKSCWQMKIISIHRALSRTNRKPDFYYRDNNYQKFVNFQNWRKIYPSTPAPYFTLIVKILNIQRDKIGEAQFSSHNQKIPKCLKGPSCTHWFIFRVAHTCIMHSKTFCKLGRK